MLLSRAGCPWSSVPCWSISIWHCSYSSFDVFIETCCQQGLRSILSSVWTHSFLHQPWLGQVVLLLDGHLKNSSLSKVDFFNLVEAFISPNSCQWAGLLKVYHLSLQSSIWDVGESGFMFQSVVNWNSFNKKSLSEWVKIFIAILHVNAVWPVTRTSRFTEQRTESHRLIHLIVVVDVRPLDGNKMSNFPAQSKRKMCQRSLTFWKFTHCGVFEVISPSLAGDRRYLHMLLHTFTRLLPGVVNALPLLTHTWQQLDSCYLTDG